MSYRTEAALRIGIGIPYYIVMLLLSPVIGISALVVWVLDLLWQLAMNTEGVGGGNVLTSVLMWYWGNLLWIMTGDDKFQPLPPL